MSSAFLWPEDSELGHRDDAADKAAELAYFAELDRAESAAAYDEQRALVCGACDGRGLDADCDGHRLGDGSHILWCGCPTCDAPDVTLVDPAAGRALAA